MTKRLCYAAFATVIILTLLVTGCVTPPKSTTSTSAPGGYYTTATTPQGAPTTQSYVSAATPFVTSTPVDQTNGQPSAIFTTPTPIPADQSCLIYLNTTYSSGINTNAISFNLKNPPMYINYTVTPFNITVTKYMAESHQGANGPETLQYSDFAPYSWFEITVRDNATGEIYLDDGFGPYKNPNPLSVYKTATLGPILNSGDLHIEMTGQNITETTGIWVKPVGNIDDPQNQTFQECKYWNGQQQNYLVTATPTTLPTWTPVNVQTPND
ncbi:MAG: hypothetical protein WCC86_03880 [Methanoregula sp.]|uniref:hypothetical protein n=3 Tax=Methanoregula sp. TaxID=2052170 RepID=UPI003BAE6B78